MSGGRLLQSFARRRSSCRSLYCCSFSQKGVCEHLNWTNCVISFRKGVVPRTFSDRAAKCWFRLPHTRFQSVCPERLALYDEQETCGDLPVVQEEEVIRLHKNERARHSKSARALEASESLVLLHSKNQEGETMVWSRSRRTLNDGDIESGGTISDGDENEAVHSCRRDRDDVLNGLTKKVGKESSRRKSKDKQEQLKDEFKNDEDDPGKPTRGKSVSAEESYAKIHDFSDVEHMFQVLLLTKQSGLQRSDKDALVKVFKHFSRKGWAIEEALHRCHISAVVFPMAVSRFRKFFFTRCTPELKDHLLLLGPSAAGDRFLFPLFREFSNREFAEEIARYKALVETADLTKPHTWFPFARAMKRKVVYHAGPTNSGKTYNAIQRFKGASSGVYCGPLRLLAMEVYDTVNADGVYCSLITGQERKEVPFANHVACTVEMVSTLKPWDVAILDEIQMLADDYRGWAWTRAFLGVQADEIHVCGDPSALNLVRDLCAVTGDDLEEHFYERFEPLSIDQQSLEGKYSKVQPGDCIVSFSRKDVFSIKRAVELFTKNRCCVIYGNLPPETRTHQARLFNDPDSGYDVLVATDAVGMGLNLNIRRVIFHTFEKYTGEAMKQVSASQVKQIAGRAGRRGTIYHSGVATTFFSRDIPYLVQCMQEPFVEAHGAGLSPGLEQIELFAAQIPGATFPKLLDRFAETCQVDGSFFLCRNDHLKQVASVIDKVQDLSLEDKMSFILAPVNSRNPKVVGALLSFALAYSRKVPVHLAMGAPTGSAKSVLQLMDLEARHQVLSLYLWLSHRLHEEYFPHKEQAEQMAADIASIMGESLTQTNIGTLQVTHHSANKKVLRNEKSPRSRSKPARRVRRD